jgi:hypothetical protein
MWWTRYGNEERLMYTFDAGVSVSGVPAAEPEWDTGRPDPLSLFRPAWNRFPGPSLVDEAVALAQCVQEARMELALPTVLRVPEEHALVSRDQAPDWREAAKSQAARVRRAGAV